MTQLEKNKINLEELVSKTNNLEVVTEGNLVWSGSTVIKSTEIDFTFLIHSYEDGYALSYYRLDDDNEYSTLFVDRYTDVDKLVDDMLMDVKCMKIQRAGITSEETI